MLRPKNIALLVCHTLKATVWKFVVLSIALLPLALSADGLLRSATTQTNIGLFYVPGAPEIESLWQDGDSGTRLYLQGRILTRHGRPISDALIEIWHADAQGSVDESRYRTAQRAKSDGTFRIKTVLPGHIEMARYNQIYGPRHIHVVVSHPDHKQLVTLIFFKRDERLAGTPYPELAIHLEEAGGANRELLIGEVELVLE